MTQYDPQGVPIPDTVNMTEVVSLLNQTSPLARTIAYIYTVNEAGSEMVVDSAPPGPRGRLFIIPPDEVVEVPEVVAKEMCLHHAYDGIVRVDQIRTRLGITFDIEKAKEESAALLAAQDQTRWLRWVNDCVEDYIKRSKPVPPPPVSILALIKRRGYKPEDYGIVPIGWAKPVSEETVVLQAANKNLMDQLAIMQSQMAQLLKERQEREADKVDEDPKAKVKR